MTLFLFLAACHVSARDDGEFMKAVLELAGCLSVEELDEDEVERYSDLHDNPLHLNYASRSKLLSSGLMSAYQVAVLMDHREMTGDILSYEELSALDGFGGKHPDGGGGLGGQFGGHVARVGAVRVGAHVLGPEPNGFGKGGVKQRKVKRGRAHDRLHPFKGGREGREAFGPAPRVGERAVHLPVGDCERSPLHRMSFLVSGSESRGEKDESRYFSVTFFGGSEEIS